jgi:hypothetical protein
VTAGGGVRTQSPTDSPPAEAADGHLVGPSKKDENSPATAIPAKLRRT